MDSADVRMLRRAAAVAARLPSSNIAVREEKGKETARSAGCWETGDDSTRQAADEVAVNIRGSSRGSDRWRQLVRRIAALAEGAT
jgi:hypothetical protein